MKPITQKWAEEAARIEQRLRLGYNLSDVNQTPLTERQIIQQKEMLSRLKDFLQQGKPKKIKTRKGLSSEKKEINSMKDYVIDIISVKYGFLKKERKKKGASKKTKMKKVRSKTLVKTVQAEEGLIGAYKSGKRGVSPKNHLFKLRNVTLQPNPNV